VACRLVGAMADAGLEMVPRCGHLPGRDDADDAEIRQIKKLLVSAAQESHRHIRSDMSQQRIRRFRGVGKAR
jgi:hypothetical protein